MTGCTRTSSAGRCRLIRRAGGDGVRQRCWRSSQHSSSASLPPSLSSSLFFIYRAAVLIRRAHSHRQRLPPAQKHYASLPAHYTSQRWTSLDAFLLSRCTELQHALDMPRDRLLSTLALVRAGVTYGGRRWGVEEALLEEGMGGGADGEDVARLNEEAAGRLMRDVYELSGTLTKGVSSTVLPSLALNLPTSALTRGGMDRLCGGRVPDVRGHARGGQRRAGPRRGRLDRGRPRAQRAALRALPLLSVLDHEARTKR